MYRHQQRGKQRNQIGISSFVENQKSGVDRVREPSKADVHGVRMSTRVVVGLKKRDLMSLRQQPGARQSADAAADDCNRAIWRRN